MDFAKYWQHTDAISQTLFFILFALSIISWVVAILRLLQSKKLVSSVAEDLRNHIHQKHTQVANLPAESQKTFVEQTLLQQISRYRFSAERGLAVLGTTASIAPFIGLFGTVWGIFHALDSIANSGQAGLGQVAGPVGEALIMTGLGLAVAIPAVLFYNIITRINRKALHIANDTAHELLAKSASGQL